MVRTKKIVSVNLSLLENLNSLVKFATPADSENLGQIPVCWYVKIPNKDKNGILNN